MKKTRAMIDRVEKRLFEYLSEKYDFNYTMTNTYAPVDGVLIKDNKIERVVEVKCRWMSLQELKSRGSYLISYEKILHGREASRAFKAPFFILLYLVLSDNIVAIQMTREDGEFISAFETEVTTTKKNMYGGKVDRQNAYVSLYRMEVIR
tara:strand:- start:956 stop:1405 length:450 start_codon:yes stop_codon:yes gene_type:complete